jgi:Family of unknown function (DUF5999)
MTDSQAPPSSARQPGQAMCQHQPPCPDALAPDRSAARTVASHPEQGWSLLCNGVVLFDDAGVLLPDGRAMRRPLSGALLAVPPLPWVPEALARGTRLAGFS